MIETDEYHANNSNPCIGICSTGDDGFCLGCLRTIEEVNNWYDQSVEWRESVLSEIKIREEKYV